MTNKSVTSSPRYLVTMLLALALCGAAMAQTAAPPSPPATAPQPADVLSNLPGPFQTIARLLPAWDPTLTNTFAKGDLTIAAVPLWKTQTASGSTPYLSTSLGYYVTRNIGVQGELVTLGNGAGSSSLDSVAILGSFRKDIGNLAFYALGGLERNCHQGRFGGDFGGGAEYRYKTRVGFFVDTRYRIESKSSTGGGNGWVTRAGLNLVF